MQAGGAAGGTCKRVQGKARAAAGRRSSAGVRSLRAAVGGGGVVGEAQDVALLAGVDDPLQAGRRGRGGEGTSVDGDESWRRGGAAGRAAERRACPRPRACNQPTTHTPIHLPTPSPCPCPSLQHGSLEVEQVRVVIPIIHRPPSVRLLVAHQLAAVLALGGRECRRKAGGGEEQAGLARGAGCGWQVRLQVCVGCIAGARGASGTAHALCPLPSRQPPTRPTAKKKAAAKTPPKPTRNSSLAAGACRKAPHPCTSLSPITTRFFWPRLHRWGGGEDGFVCVSPARQANASLASRSPCGIPGLCCNSGSRAEPQGLHPCASRPPSPDAEVVALPAGAVLPRQRGLAALRAGGGGSQPVNPGASACWPVQILPSSHHGKAANKMHRSATHLAQVWVALPPRCQAGALLAGAAPAGLQAGAGVVGGWWEEHGGHSPSRSACYSAAALL